MERSLRRFAVELRRRKVYRAAAGYVLVAFVVWQAADIAFPALGLPPGALTAVLVATILGFPLALVLAWSYELSPEGGSGAPTGAEAAGCEARCSIAVLPFSNLSTELGSQYFADGIAEELINALAQIRGLRVVARTSSFRFRETGADAREIGQTLGVSHVVEGSIRRSGGLLRVTAQLVDAKRGWQLWSDRFERPVGDVFRIQDEIVQAVAESLLRRLPSESEQRGFARAVVPEAYDAYLRARSAQMELDAESIGRATRLYQTAIGHDASCALAYAGLADALLLLAAGFGTDRPGPLVRRARVAIEEALELAPHLPEAHVARATLLLFHEWDYDGARRELERALELSPSSLEAHLTMEMYHTYVRADGEAALAMATRACELSPIDPRARIRLGYVHVFAGRLRRAEAVFRAMVDADQAFTAAAIGLAETLTRTGHTLEAASLARRALEVGPASDNTLGQAGAVLAACGHGTEAVSCLRELEDRGARGAAAHFWEGVLLAALGWTDDAFEHIDRALAEHDPSLLFLSVVPVPALRDDPRYAQALRRLGLGGLPAAATPPPLVPAAPAETA